jgi:hypothetical protein
MSTIKNALTGAVAVAAVICIFTSTMAWAHGQGGGKDSKPINRSAIMEC